MTHVHPPKPGSDFFALLSDVILAILAMYATDQVIKFAQDYKMTKARLDYVEEKLHTASAPVTTPIDPMTPPRKPRKRSVSPQDAVPDTD